MTQAPASSRVKNAVGMLTPLFVAFVVKAKSLMWLGGSMLSMIASIGVFTMMFGLPYALSVVLLIYIHEAGHWIWMKAMGLDPRAPMFIPGLGAFVAMNKLPNNQSIHAWVSLAGPLIGGLGCAIMYLLGVHLNNQWLTTSANTGFMLNLIQMIPAKPLDGGFVVAAISRWILIPGTLGLFALGTATGSPFVFVIALISLLSWFSKPAKPAPQDALASAGIPDANPAKSKQDQEELPATGIERFVIAVAYLSLIGVLAAGSVLSSFEVSSLLHR
jgi:Zn-dependent protease